MHDEASPFYVEMVDQTTRGHQVGQTPRPPLCCGYLDRHPLTAPSRLAAALLSCCQFLKKNFGDNAIPRGTWQIE